MSKNQATPISAEVTQDGIVVAGRRFVGCGGTYTAGNGDVITISKGGVASFEASDQSIWAEWIKNVDGRRVAPSYWFKEAEMSPEELCGVIASRGDGQ